MKDETSKSKIINDELLKLQEEWFNVCDIYSMARTAKTEKCPLSEPFSFAVTEQYTQSKDTIMIIGQETRDFGEFNSGKFDEENLKLGDIHDMLSCSQNFTEEYFKRQLNISDEYEFNKSPFWRLFREIANIGVEPAWNNLNKFHRIINGETARLSLDIERELSKTYGKDNKSLLQREFELTKPSLVLFVTGPYYYTSMASALNVTDSLLHDYQPTKNIPCQQITDIVNMNVPILWSYHPGYLNRIRYMPNIIDMIQNFVRK